MTPDGWPAAAASACASVAVARRGAGGPAAGLPVEPLERASGAPPATEAAPRPAARRHEARGEIGERASPRRVVVGERSREAVLDRDDERAGASESSALASGSSGAAARRGSRSSSRAMRTISPADRGLGVRSWSPSKEEELGGESRAHRGEEPVRRRAAPRPRRGGRRARTAPTPRRGFRPLQRSPGARDRRLGQVERPPERLEHLRSSGVRDPVARRRRARARARRGTRPRPRRRAPDHLGHLRGEDDLEAGVHDVPAHHPLRVRVEHGAGRDDARASRSCARSPPASTTARRAVAEEAGRDEVRDRARRRAGA